MHWGNHVRWNVKVPGGGRALENSAGKIKSRSVARAVESAGPIRLHTRLPGSQPALGQTPEMCANTNSYKQVRLPRAKIVARIRRLNGIKRVRILQALVMIAESAQHRRRTAHHDDGLLAPGRQHHRPRRHAVGIDFSRRTQCTCAFGGLPRQDKRYRCGGQSCGAQSQRRSDKKIAAFLVGGLARMQRWRIHPKYLRRTGIERGSASLRHARHAVRTRVMIPGAPQSSGSAVAIIADCPIRKSLRWLIVVNKSQGGRNPVALRAHGPPTSFPPSFRSYPIRHDESAGWHADEVVVDNDSMSY